MCSLILKPVDPSKPKNRVFRAINRWVDFGNSKYLSGISRIIKNPKRVGVGFCMVLIAIFVLYRIIPTSFLPTEDQGYFTIELELPEGTTLERTRAVTDRTIQFLMKEPAVEYVQNVTGTSPRVGTSQARAQLTVILKEWKERDDTTIGR